MKIKVTGLWKREKEGHKYLVGKIGQAQLVILPNENRRSDRDPDYEAFVTSPDPVPQKEGGPRVPPAK